MFGMIYQSFRLVFLYSETSVSRMALRSGRILSGDTDSSSTPMARNSRVNVESAPSSPQIPVQMPALWEFSTTWLIIRSTAG